MPSVRSAPRGTTARPEQRRGAGQVLLLASAGPLIAGYLGIAALLALVTATASGATLSTIGVLRAAGPGWLAVYHVPIDIVGHELGMLPLLPTALALALVGRSAGNAARRLEWDTPRRAARVISAVGAAHGVFGLVIALLCAGGTVSASPVAAFFGPGLLAAAAATVGTARQCWLVSAALARADDATETGLRAGGLAVFGLAAVGTVVLAVGLLASWSTAARLFHAAAPGFGPGLGMFLLSLAYLPNVLIGALSFTAGPGFAIGQVQLAQWAFHGGALPAVPVLASLPVTQAHWWPVLMLLPAGVGVLVGLSCRNSSARTRSVAVAALVAAVTWLVLAALAGGAMAGGPFDPVTVPSGALGAAVFLLVAGPGMLTVPLTGRGVVTEPSAEPEEEPEPEPEEE
ncbi:MAG TPA: DUF6350 family protein [Pseudonocardiaceae bacterium]